MYRPRASCRRCSRSLVAIPRPRRFGSVRMLLSSSCPGSSPARAPVPTISLSTEATQRRTPGACSPRRSSACRLSAGAVGARSSRCAPRNAPRLGWAKSARSIVSRIVACCRDHVAVTFRTVRDGHHLDGLSSATTARRQRPHGITHRDALSAAYPDAGPEHLPRRVQRSMPSASLWLGMCHEGGPWAAHGVEPAGGQAAHGTAAGADRDERADRQRRPLDH